MANIPDYLKDIKQYVTVAETIEKALKDNELSLAEIERIEKLPFDIKSLSKGGFSSHWDAKGLAFKLELGFAVTFKGSEVITIDEAKKETCRLINEDISLTREYLRMLTSSIGPDKHGAFQYQLPMILKHALENYNPEK